MRIRHKIFKLSFLQVLLILSIGCKTHYQPVKSQFESVQVKSSQDTMGYSVTEKYLAPYRQQLQDSFSTVISTTTGDLVKRRPGGSLGNLVVEAIRNDKLRITNSKEKRHSFILMNYGGIRLKEIAQGDITMGKVFELLPFENTIVRIEITGKEMRRLMENINSSGGWPLRFVSPHKFESPANGEKETYSLQKIAVSNLKYTLITNNYIATGGDNCSILKTLPQEDTGILLRDIVIDYLRKEKIITPDNTEYILK